NVSVPILQAESSSGAEVPSPSTPGAPAIASVEAHTARAEAQYLKLQVQLAPRSDAPPLRIPQLRMTQVRSTFSLADITDYTPFQKLGERIAADPVGELRRVRLSARVVQGADGLRRTDLVTSRAVD